MNKPDTSTSTGRNIVVAAKYVAMLAPFISKSEIRYYLNGIHIEPHHEQGVLMVATDGHHMGIVHDKEGMSNDPWICSISANVLKACRYQPRRKGSVLEQAAKVHFLENSAVVTNGKFAGDSPLDTTAGILSGVMVMERAPAIDGTFPNWRKILPKKRPGAAAHKPLAYNPGLMANFTHVFRAAGLLTGQPCVLFPGGSDEPTVARFEGVPEFFALLMPMHTKHDVVAIPAWVSKERLSGRKKTVKRIEAKKAA